MAKKRSRGPTARPGQSDPVAVASPEPSETRSPSRPCWWTCQTSRVMRVTGH